MGNYFQTPFGNSPVREENEVFGEKFPETGVIPTLDALFLKTIVTTPLLTVPLA
jgi:hypothetical protein